MPASSPSRLPELGPRGEGWVAAQAVLLVTIALSALVGLGWPDELETAAWVVGGLLLAAGTLLVVVGALQLGPSLTAFPAPRTGGELSAAGLYRRVRHPMYGGAVLLALGWSIVFASAVGAVLTLVLVVFFDLKARREEAWLAERYPAYADYCRRTRRKFVPFVY
jgi:protein-S-isoprenylcysteine O-methyltransferase Ste14